MVENQAYKSPEGGESRDKPFAKAFSVKGIAQDVNLLLEVKKTDSEREQQVSINPNWGHTHGTRIKLRNIVRIKLRTTACIRLQLKLPVPKIGSEITFIYFPCYRLHLLTALSAAKLLPPRPKRPQRHLLTALSAATLLSPRHKRTQRHLLVGNMCAIFTLSDSQSFQSTTIARGVKFIVNTRNKYSSQARVHIAPQSNSGISHFNMMQSNQKPRVISASKLTSDLHNFRNQTCSEMTKGKKSPPVKKSPQAPQPNAPRTSSPTASISSTTSSRSSVKRPVSSPEDRQSSNLKLLKSDNLTQLNADFVNEKLNLLNVNAFDKDVAMSSTDNPAHQGAIRKTSVADSDFPTFSEEDEDADDSHTTNYMPRGFEAALEEGQRARDENIRLATQLKEAQELIRSLQPPSRPEFIGNQSNRIVPIDQANQDQNVNNQETINMVLRPKNYPHAVITDESTKKIETSINSLFRRSRNRFSMDGVGIKECKFGVIFINCKSLPEANRLLAIVNSTQWVKEGIPDLACVLLSEFVPSPVLNLWIPTKMDSFDEACVKSEEYIHNGTDAWRLIKAIDQPARKGVNFLFVCDDALAKMIEAIPVIGTKEKEFKFKYGFYQTPATISIPKGYRGMNAPCYDQSYFRFLFVQSQVTTQQQQPKTTTLRLSKNASSPKSFAAPIPTKLFNLVGIGTCVRLTTLPAVRVKTEINPVNLAILVKSSELNHVKPNIKHLMKLMLSGISSRLLKPPYSTRIFKISLPYFASRLPTFLESSEGKDANSNIKIKEIVITQQSFVLIHRVGPMFVLGNLLHVFSESRDRCETLPSRKLLPDSTFSETIHTHSHNVSCITTTLNCAHTTFRVCLNTKRHKVHPKHTLLSVLLTAKVTLTLLHYGIGIRNNTIKKSESTKYDNCSSIKTPAIHLTQLTQSLMLWENG